MITFAERKELFKTECKVVCLEYEYPNYTGIEKWAIITDLSEEELNIKYADEIASFRPFVVLSAAFGQVRDDYIRNENKHHMRAVRNGHAFDFSEDTEEHHIDSFSEENLLGIEECFYRYNGHLVLTQGARYRRVLGEVPEPSCFHSLLSFQK